MADHKFQANVRPLLHRVKRGQRFEARNTEGFAFLSLTSLCTPLAAARPFQSKKPLLGLWHGESGLPVVV